MEENNYYPFGLKHKGYNNVINGTENNFQTFHGQEEEKELGKNTIAYKWRDYDAAIGRFYKLDRFAEKYYSTAPYAFVKNNPILNREIAGDSIGQGKGHFNKFRAKVQKKRDKIDAKRNKKLTKATNKGDTDKVNRLNAKYAAQDADSGSNSAIVNQTLTELTALEDSSQVYNLITNSSEVTGNADGNITYNTGSGEVNVNVSNGFSVGTFAHELKHAYQFQTGRLSFSASGNGGVLYDIQDEVEAYSRGAFFGGRALNQAGIISEYSSIARRLTQRTLNTVPTKNNVNNRTYLQIWTNSNANTNGTQFFLNPQPQN